MSRPVVYFAVTGHGFGHAVRAASVAAALQHLNPDVLPVLVTPAPHWLLASYLGDDFLHRPRTFDVGVVQSDSLQMDLPATAASWQAIRDRAAQIIKSEADFIRTNRARLVVADIPPLAGEIARAAGVPCWAIGNFGWDFIYRDWGEDFTELVDWIAEQYARCELLWRLPLHEAMGAFPTIRDVGLTGGIPRLSVDEARAFGLSTERDRTALLTFGGLGLAQTPYHNLERFPDWKFITFDANAPELPNLIRVRDRRYRPVDFMPFCERVVSKPGFSTFSEAMRLSIPIVSLTREGFAESPVLLAGLQDYSAHQIVEADEFFHGNWSFLHRSPTPARQPGAISTDGSETIARAICEYLSTTRASPSIHPR
ncbi:putative glycosyl transferase [Rubidibacter lacunae KORDI 51-2]|uniref:Putative glycosyl transferase n=1 Tax=Rubidibacter lacunae KORDI 51-2 TaxID=582515 RepID=U5D7T1_9CHRO|nr:glycosyl transferase [Rubidibacter lacunae]ERN40668.1 putative glycosyl transferase [Rubidibacter lacunae KORDI 51-2]